VLYEIPIKNNPDNNLSSMNEVGIAFQNKVIRVFITAAVKVCLAMVKNPGSLQGVSHFLNPTF
jgi:hypothetical protein